MSKAWRKNQSDDRFYAKAKSEGYRSRAAYKLLEIQNKFHVIQRDSSILDLGCAPGGWLQIARKYTNGPIVGIDLQEIAPIQSVHFGQFDFTNRDKLIPFLESVSAPHRFSVILSDMSPAISGDRETDHYCSVELTRSVLEFSQDHLQAGGYMVCKLLDGIDTNLLLTEIKKSMSVKIFKPESSRSDSREIYLICKNLH
jgi:23S rRNA (uridine2552-2'-O)-methyltransferase